MTGAQLDRHTRTLGLGQPDVVDTTWPRLARTAHDLALRNVVEEIRDGWRPN